MKHLHNLSEQICVFTASDAWRRWMAMIKRIGVIVLAEVIALSCPWYLRRRIYCQLRWFWAPILLATIVIVMGIFPRFGDNALHHASLPVKLFWPGILKEFEQVFPIPDELQHHVAFWKDVFARYTSSQVILYDSWYFQVIYEVVDTQTSPGINAHIQKYKHILLELDRKQRKDQLHSLSGDEARVYKLFENIPDPQKFRKAASQHFRLQSGQRDHFVKAVERAGLYQEQFEQIFQKHDLPRELIWLSLVESYFKQSAYSSAGAAGVWQFMPATAKMYGLRINAQVDERYDPFKSANSAARLLKANYDIFGSWPLAITAYNHGTAGVLNAVKQVKTTDLGKIVREYQGSSFGFYSRNYYAEFVAAAHIMYDYKRYLGPIEQLTPLEYEKVPVTQKIYVKDLVKNLSIPEETFVMLNRELKRTVIQSKSPLPHNFVLKIPPGKKDQFLKYYNNL
ncbi:peptidoglycan-binding LysM:Lytic transglycosylase, catalytic [Candidatus Vecturithrix granuli]|uniref:Peptidoglycan-binding LysM:Lytic transglycosylase, catalytic n=1 Tax=Vecturithrix granuli TaxID=1499967 RepID=A0A081C1N6_VECG1|nr:peptidoglycan-binding LysM:Lytic transglycosylase, catalytic [Candidatus Vecturithrix granuli]